jgi:hypothetical protein
MIIKSILIFLPVIHKIRIAHVKNPILGVLVAIAFPLKPPNAYPNNHIIQPAWRPAAVNHIHTWQGMFLAGVDRRWVESSHAKTFLGPRRGDPFLNNASD